MVHRIDRSVLKTAALCIALSGCAMPGSHHFGGGPAPKTAPKPCPPGNCELKVTVNDCKARGGITVEPDNVSVDEAKNMRWTIVTPGYEFTANGIMFFPPNPQFEYRHNPRPNEFHVHNRKDQPGDYYYFVNVKGCLPADPWVHNN
jgi:hypothetical protein